MDFTAFRPKKALAILIALGVCTVNGQFNESSFVGLSSLGKAIGYGWNAGSVDVFGFVFGTSTAGNITTWANGLTCKAGSVTSGNQCFAQAIEGAIQQSAGGVTGTNLGNHDYVNVVHITSSSITGWYNSTNVGQGTADGSTNLVPNQCIGPNVNKVMLTQNSFTSKLQLQSINTNGFTIRVTCKSACNQATPDTGDLQAAAAAVAQTMMDNNSWAARAVFLTSDDSIAYARCRITVVQGDGYALSHCPDFIPSYGCAYNGDDQIANAFTKRSDRITKARSVDGRTWVAKPFPKPQIPASAPQGATFNGAA